MKKLKSLMIATIGCAAITAGYQVWNYTESATENSAMLENIEALVATECTAPSSHCYTATSSSCWVKATNASGDVHYLEMTSNEHVGSYPACNN